MAVSLGESAKGLFIYLFFLYIFFGAYVEYFEAFELRYSNRFGLQKQAH